MALIEGQGISVSGSRGFFSGFVEIEAAKSKWALGAGNVVGRLRVLEGFGVRIESDAEVAAIHFGKVDGVQRSSLSVEMLMKIFESQRLRV
jgi:hypothetical protein